MTPIVNTTVGPPRQRPDSMFDVGMIFSVASERGPYTVLYSGFYTGSYVRSTFCVPLRVRYERAQEAVAFCFALSDRT